MGINPSKGKAPFFLPFLTPYEFHTKDFTLPVRVIRNACMGWTYSQYEY
jgi:hypothetical protein